LGAVIGGMAERHHRRKATATRIRARGRRRQSGEIVNKVAKPDVSAGGAGRRKERGFRAPVAVCHGPVSKEAAR